MMLPIVNERYLEFPDFCMRPPSEGRRLITNLSVSLANEYRKNNIFTEIKTVRVEVGTPVFMESEFDLSARGGIRIYRTQELLAAIQRALGWVDSEKVRVAFETTIRRSCWGVLAVVVGRNHPNDVRDLRLLIEAVESCWSGLGNLRYVNHPTELISLSSLLQDRFSGLLAMWARHPTGNVIPDLLAALATLETASDEDRADVSACWLAKLAANNTRIRHKNKLASSSLLRQHFVALEQFERNSIELGSQSTALTFLYGLDRELMTRR